MNKEVIPVAKIGIVFAAITLCWIAWCMRTCDPNGLENGANRAKAELYDREHPGPK